MQCADKRGQFGADTHGIPCIVASDYLQNERGIFHSPCHRTTVIERLADWNDAADANQPVRRLEPDDAAIGRWQADRGERIRTERRATEPRRDRGARTARGATRDARPPSGSP